MDLPYQYTPYIWPMLVVAVGMGLLAWYGGRHRNTPGALPFILLMLAAALWSVGSAFEVAASDLATKFTWFKFQNAIFLFAALTSVWFALAYAGLNRWLRPVIVGLLFAPLPVNIALHILDRGSALLWTRFWLDGTVHAELAPVGMAFGAYSMTLLLTSLAIMLALYVHSPLHRKAIGIILLGQIAVRAAAVAQVANLASTPINPSVQAVGLAGLAYAIALFRFGFFTQVPIAAQIVFERMTDAVVVLNPEGRVADLNREAERRLGIRRAGVLGKHLAEAVAGFPQLLQPDGRVVPPGTEIQVGDDAASRFYRVSLSPLVGGRGFRYGFLMVLLDVTDLTQIRQRLFEERLVLATLRERERVASELHDTLSQQLAYIHLQAQAARERLASGQTREVDALLGRLTEVARGAHAEVRGLISGLMTPISRDSDFLATVASQVQDFSRRFGIPADLALPDEPLTVRLERAAEVQLLRIIQEALANTRKHACAQHVRVGLQVDRSEVELVIEDDGCGFDPALLDGNHDTFGLAIMRQRAEEVGAALEIDTAPGHGTRISVKLPGIAMPVVESEGQEG